VAAVPSTRTRRPAALALLGVGLATVALLAACGAKGRADAAGAAGDTTGATEVEVTTPTTPPGPPMTSCKTVVHLGDSTSIGLFSTAYLPKPADRIDAQYARVGVATTQNEVSGARSVVEHLKDQTNAEDRALQLKAGGYEGCWVLALGTTDAADIAAGSKHFEDERIDRMMKAVDGDPVLWVNVKTIETKGNWANPNMVKFDQVLDGARARYPNLHVYDWAAVAQDNWFTTDKIHYTSAGYAQRARLIADALAAEIPAGDPGTGATSTSSADL
jgi:hypothetical protein